MTNLLYYEDKFYIAHEQGVCSKPDPNCPYCISELVREYHDLSDESDNPSRRLVDACNAGLTLYEAVTMLLQEKKLNVKIQKRGLP